jgi:hypothetical protein
VADLNGVAAEALGRSDNEASTVRLASFGTFARSALSRAGLPAHAGSFEETFDRRP